MMKYQEAAPTAASTEALLNGKTCVDHTPSSTTKSQVQILLCGCGNAVHVLIPYICHYGQTSAEYDFTVHVLSSHADRLVTSLPEHGRIRCVTDTGAVREGKAHLISSDPAVVVPGCNVILFALPTDRHEMYLKSMLPFIQEGTMIGSMPGEGGFDLCIRDILGPALTDKCTLFSLETLPWACRIETFGNVVRVLGTKQDIDLCVRPRKQYSAVRHLIQAMIGPLPAVLGSPTSNFLGVTLMNPNAIAHPSIEYGILHDWDGVTPFDKPPLFYQGMDDFTAATMQAVSNEILAIKRKIQTQYPTMDLTLVRSIQDFLEESYAQDIVDHSTLRTMFVTHKGYDGLTLPTETTADGKYLPLFDHRYFHEDLPCGLLVQRGIAELAGVPTPVMDKIILWCQARVHKEYLVAGKLQGKDMGTTKTPQRYGYKDLASFIHANGYADADDDDDDA